ncbi:carboxyl transferase domain-containing protein [Clostridium polynesiense]|uniref:carboxyl transferase domain-containing protein n=1 Tax=Clostridium polynesiense TaxID=1325933 RepID=UPI00058D8193|nr:carboxyl transferase domain-containing protein [Clostridium polynesiense]
MDRIEELLQRKKEVLSGNKEGVDMQHNLQKLTARERIHNLLDEDSFVEIGVFSGNSSSGTITGYGTVDGRLVYVISQDYSYRGGAVNARNTQKTVNTVNMALKMGAPLIYIFDSVGIDASENLKALRYYGELVKSVSMLSGVVPTFAVAAGPCTGMAAVLATLCDFTILCSNSGEFYVNDAEKLAEASGKYVEYNGYAGSESASQTGSIKLTVKDDKEALMTVKKLLDYIPSNNLAFPPVSDININGSFSLELKDQQDMESYSIEEIIESAADKDSIIEFAKEYEDSTLTALIKINGRTAGVVGIGKKSTPLSSKSIEKVTGFVKLCDSFNIPLITVVKHAQSFGASAVEEKEGLALSLSKLMYSLAQAVVPKISLITGKALGTGYITFCSKESAYDMVLAWPSASVALSLNSLKEAGNIYSAAEEGLVDDVILPSETKLRLYMALDMLYTKREIKYPKKHGSALI